MKILVFDFYFVMGAQFGLSTIIMGDHGNF